MKNVVREYCDGTYEYSLFKKDDAKVLAKYVELQCMFVDDAGAVHRQGEVYVRNGRKYCCGRPLAKLDGHKYCTMCAKFH